MIFCDELGGIINPRRLTEKFKQLRDRAAIRPGRLHDVRHSHASHLLTAYDPKDPSLEPMPPVPVHVVSRPARPLEPGRGAHGLRTRAAAERRNGCLSDGRRPRPLAIRLQNGF